MKAVLGSSIPGSPKTPRAGTLGRDVGANLVFRLDGKRMYITITPHAAGMGKILYGKGIRGHSHLPGQRGGNADRTPAPGYQRSPGAQSTGAGIVSFNLDAFLSYNKKQNFNAPVGESAAFAYTTALNHLLRFESRQRIRIGDATTVFWTERSSPIERFMGVILDPRENAADLAGVHLFLAAARDGKPLPAIGDPDLRFYILGLSPNASRLSIRFWHVSTVADVSEKIGQHFRDIAIVRSERDPEFPGM